MKFKYSTDVVMGMARCASCERRPVNFCLICAKPIHGTQAVSDHLESGNCLLNNDAVSAILSKIEKIEAKNKLYYVCKAKKYKFYISRVESIGYKMLFRGGKCLICNKIPTGGPGQKPADHIKKCIANLHRENEIGELIVEIPSLDQPICECKLCGGICYNCEHCNGYHKLTRNNLMRHGNGYICVDCGHINQEKCMKSDIHICFRF